MSEHQQDAEIEARHMRLRYKRDHPYGLRFPTIRYPSKPTTRERCEQIRAAMPDPEAFEVCEEEE